MTLGSHDSYLVPGIATEEKENRVQRMSHSCMTQLRKQRREQTHKEDSGILYTETRFST